MFRNNIKFSNSGFVGLKKCEISGQPILNHASSSRTRKKEAHLGQLIYSAINWKKSYWIVPLVSVHTTIQNKANVELTESWKSILWFLRLIANVSTWKFLNFFLSFFSLSLFSIDTLSCPQLFLFSLPLLRTFPDQPVFFFYTISIKCGLPRCSSFLAEV